MERKNLVKLIVESWNLREGNVNKTKDLLKWINDLNRNTSVDVKKASIDEDSFWFYDDVRGEILNRKRSFFSIVGMRYFINDAFIKEQPIIEQNEIGYLGIIVKEIDGVLNFLMQAKIEPGNVNCVQISPTIQATRSNFIRAHGGKLPLYFEWFEKADKNGEVIYDQLQSEQGSRFDCKRNRNIILKIDSNKEIEIHKNYNWMTLGQIKELLKIDNLVNMDTRTVLSGLPVLSDYLSKDELSDIKTCFNDEALFNSLYSKNTIKDIQKAHYLINNYKMNNDIKKIIVPLYQLTDWKVSNTGIKCKEDSDFEVNFYDIEIEGREVRKWTQPLFKANTKGLFVLFTKVINNERKYLIQLNPEIGCFDKTEFGPTIQQTNPNKTDYFLNFFEEHKNEKKRYITNVLLSEEGGRFYHEENRNIIFEIYDKDQLRLPSNYFWVNFATLYKLCQNNNYLNIQLRNLLSLIEI